MTYCQACAHPVHETAIACPQCGAVQPGATPIPKLAQTQPAGTLWLPVPALICALIPVLALLDTAEWDKDQLIGAFIFITAAFLLGGMGLARQTRGRGMCIAALVLGGIGLLGAIGMSV